MRSMVLAAIAVAALAGCNKPPVLDAATGEPVKGPPTPAAKAVAMKIVDAGGVLSMDKKTLEQVAIQQLQRLHQQDPELTTDQLMAAKTGITKNLEAAVPQMKEAMQAALTDTFTKPELDLLLKLVTSKEGKAIGEHMQEVSEKSFQVVDAVVSNASDKAVKEMKSAWPAVQPKPAPAPTGPSGPGGPGGAPTIIGPDGKPIDLSKLGLPPQPAQSAPPAKPK
ncbi:MAG TPA: hypothetical protein VG942_18210 [Hyphomonadaceae bacterium]|nr:hypothetical protein [Hyphomonadaceae bacterium]